MTASTALGRRVPSSRRLLVGPVVAVLTVLSIAAAWAFWTTDVAAGSSGAAGAATVDQGARPSASVVDATVTVSWNPTALSSGAAVDGYLIRRYDAGTLVPASMTGTCAGTVTASSCTEPNVLDGSWVYTVTPVVGTAWRGAESESSAVVTVAFPDTLPPTNVLTLSVSSGAAVMTGSTVHYRGAAAGSLVLRNALTDTRSGPASSTTGVLSGSTAGWTHAPSAVSTPAGGPYVSAPFSWAAGTTSAPTVGVAGHDVAGNTAATTVSFVEDSAAPTGSIGYPDGVSARRSVTLDLTAADPGPVSPTGRCSALPPRGPTAPAAPSPRSSTSARPPPSRPGRTCRWPTATCYRYQYVVVDRLGHRAVLTIPPSP